MQLVHFPFYLSIYLCLHLAMSFTALPQGYYLVPFTHHMLQNSFLFILGFQLDQNQIKLTRML